MADPTLGDSSFGVLFELELGAGLFAYNQVPLTLTASILCVTPNRMYSHPAGCIPLFDSPTPGVGNFVANLVTANHDPLPDCMDDTDCPKCEVCDTGTFTCVKLQPEICCRIDTDCDKCETCEPSLEPNVNKCEKTVPGCCSSDEQCPAFGKCVPGICNPDNNTCEPGQKEEGCCSSDDQCLQKCESCDQVNNECVRDPVDLR